jgi:peroxiredoxin Q/BCP
LRQFYNELTARDTEVVVLGPDSTDAFREYWARHDLPFVGLPDPSHTVLKLYGQQVNLFKLGRMPATVLVDKGGVVRLAHYGRSMGDVSSTEEVLAALDGLHDEPAQS